MFNRTAAEMRAIHEQLKTEPVAVVLLYQSHCDYTNATKPHVEQLANQFGFTLVKLLCDHLTPEMAGLAIPSLTVFRFGVQVSNPLRGARRREVLEAFLAHHGVLHVPDASGA